MKKNKILPIVLALAVTVSIGISVFAVAYTASADDTKKVQLVTLDYIENSLMKQIDEKIKLGSVESMQQSIEAINSTLDYLNTQVATNAGGIKTASGDISAIRDLISSLEEKVDSLEDQTDLKTLQAQIAALSDRVNTFEGTCSVLAQSIVDLKSSVGKIEDKMNGLESGLDELKTYSQNSLMQLTGIISTTEANIAALTQTADEMKIAADAVKGQINDLAASYSVLLSRITSLESQASTDRTELMQLKISLSSLEIKLSDMSGDYGEIIDAYNEYTKTIAALRTADGGNASFSAIFLKQGEVLTCSGLPSDTMEIIVRRGNVAVTSPIPTQGILDITDSVELLNGKKITEYHYLMLVGGGDGRGIVSQSGDAWILVRGEYEIG